MRFALLTTAMLSLLIFHSASCQAGETIYQSGDFRLLGDSPNQISLGAGVFESGNEHNAWAGLAEIRFGRKYSFIGPAVGVMANADGGTIVYTALYADILWKRIALTPLWGVGAYFEGDSRDLGGTFQFRTALTASWVFESGRRLGFNLAHISNANLHDANPGANELMLIYSIPF